MKILVNRKVKLLFGGILSCVFAFTLIAALLSGSEVRNAAVYTMLCFLLMDAVILALCYGYFRQQHKIMENAVSQITEYISGNKDVTIECNDEGELYRLFHEVNSLVAILNAHAENEKSAKKFLKNTISDISHQLKTPLAALDIYIGLIQDEAKNLPVIQEFSLLSERDRRTGAESPENHKTGCGYDCVRKISGKRVGNCGKRKKAFPVQSRTGRKGNLSVGQRGNHVFMRPRLDYRGDQQSCQKCL